MPSLKAAKGKGRSRRTLRPVGLFTPAPQPQGKSASADVGLDHYDLLLNGIALVPSGIHDREAKPISTGRQGAIYGNNRLMSDHWLLWLKGGHKF